MSREEFQWLIFFENFLFQSLTLFTWIVYYYYNQSPKTKYKIAAKRYLEIDKKLLYLWKKIENDVRFKNNHFDKDKTVSISIVIGYLPICQRSLPCKSRNLKLNRRGKWLEECTKRESNEHQSNGVKDTNKKKLRWGGWNSKVIFLATFLWLLTSLFIMLLWVLVLLLVVFSNLKIILLS